MHRGLYWRTSEGLQLDTGAFLAGLEQAAATQAEVIGKPAAAFFATALAHLGAGPAGTVMVGDDIETDVLAAQRQGLTGVLVKTGKYLPARTGPPAAPPAMSWTPSPACPPCSSNCNQREGSNAPNQAQDAAGAEALASPHPTWPSTAAPTAPDFA